MTKVRNATSIALLFAASLCLMSVADAKTSKPKKVYTDFGYVLVDPLDVEGAINEGQAAQEAARRVLLLSGLRFAIVEEGSDGNSWGSLSKGYIVYPWPFPNGSRRFAARPSTHALRHEIGHDLLARYLIPRSTDNQYGTDAPDWLDEMAAIAFEGMDQQLDRRRATTKEAAGVGLLPLDRLLSMEHPEFKRKIEVDSKSAFVTTEPTSSDTIRFYSTVLALYDFLVSRTGNRAIVAELAATYMRREDLTAWLIRRLSPDGGSIEQMNASFLQWLANDPRYSGLASNA